VSFMFGCDTKSPTWLCGGAWKVPTAPAVLPAVSYRGSQLPGQRSLLLWEGSQGVSCNCDYQQHKVVGNQDRVDWVNPGEVS